MGIRVAGIPGSLREGSLNKGLLRAAAELAPSGMQIQIYTRLSDIPRTTMMSSKKAIPNRSPISKLLSVAPTPS